MLALALFACTQDSALVVGAKPFAEQRILGEALRMVLLSNGEKVAPLEVCADTWDCQHRLQAGDLDVAVDYTGTGLSLVAAPAGGTALTRVRAAYEPLGVSWLEPLGFENTYVLMVPDWRAVAQEVGSISDAATLGPLTVAVPPEFVRRPTDGLGPLTRRYGLQLGDTLVEADVAARLQLVVDGRADVAVAYSTDGAIAAQPLVPLDDDLGFFPQYDAVVVANTAALQGRAGLGEAAAALAGRLDERQMQALNAEVEIAGYEPAQVARTWLREEGLVEGAVLDLEAPAGLAVDPTDGLEGLVEPARQALRDALPDQAVQVVSGDPVEALELGEARVAIVGAERFFAPGRRGLEREALVAEAVVGTRYVHLVGAASPATVGVVGGGAARVAELLWDAETVQRAGVAELLADLGSYDAALVLAEPGDPTLAAALQGAGATLQAVRPPVSTDLAWLRPARLPAGTYAGQAEALDTVTSQVVLASASVPSDPMLAGGPVAALPSSPRPLARDEAERLARAVGSTELPDPVLPVAREATAAATEDTAVLDTALNLAVLAFLGWLGVLAVGREP